MYYKARTGSQTRSYLTTQLTQCMYAILLLLMPVSFQNQQHAKAECSISNNKQVCRWLYSLFLAYGHPSQLAEFAANTG